MNEQEIKVKKEPKESNVDNDNNAIKGGRRANEINMKKICLWIDNIIHGEILLS